MKTKKPADVNSEKISLHSNSQQSINQDSTFSDNRDSSAGLKASQSYMATSPRLGQLKAQQKTIQQQSSGVKNQIFPIQLSADDSVVPESETVQLISDADARVRLGVKDDDSTANNAVEIIKLIHQIIDEIPKLEAAIAKYPVFLDSHVNRPERAAKKGDLKRWMDGSMKYITSNLASYIEVLEGMEDWYTDAVPSERNSIAAQYVAGWRQDYANFQKQIAPVDALLSYQSGPLYDYMDIFSKGYGALGALKGLLGEWLKGGGGFSAVGRAHDIAVEIVAKDATPKVDTLKKDNSFFENFKMDSETKNMASGSDVYKANLTENNLGPTFVTGRLRTAAENGNRGQLLSDAEAGMIPAENDEKTFVAVPAPMDRGKGQLSNMNNTNARGYAWLLNMDGWNSSSWEWLHIRAASLGGETTSRNLILGTRDANTHMMPFESNVRTLASLIKQHPQLESLTVNWKAHYKHPEAGVKHAYELISISWNIKPMDTASETWKQKAKKANGKAIFDILHTGSLLSKSEVQQMEATLHDIRDSLQSED